MNSQGFGKLTVAGKKKNVNIPAVMAEKGCVGESLEWWGVCGKEYHIGSLSGWTRNVDFC